MLGYFKELNMKNTKKVIRFTVVIAIVFIMVCFLVACGDDSKSGPDDGDDDKGKNAQDTTINEIEAAFVKMLSSGAYGGYGGFWNYEHNTRVNRITNISNWGQTNSEYSVSSQEHIKYRLPWGFSIDKEIISDGDVYFLGNFYSIDWGTPTGNTTYISEVYDEYESEGETHTYLDHYILSSSNAITVTYPYTIYDDSDSDSDYNDNGYYVSRSNARFISGKLNLNLNK
jgi:hypothetical protein